LTPVTVIVTGSPPAIAPSGEIDDITGSVVVNGAPLTRAPGEKREPPLPVAVECVVNPPIMSGLRVID
jgi:hypothetical protein